MPFDPTTAQPVGPAQPGGAFDPATATLGSRLPQRENDTVDEVLGFAAGANDAMLGLPRVLAAGARSLAHGLTNPVNEYRQLRTEQEAAKVRAPDAALAGDVAGSVATAAVPIGNVARAGRLALKAGEPVMNLLRLAGAGSVGGAQYGAARGASEALQAGKPEDVAAAALAGAGEGAVGGAVAGPIGAGVVKGAMTAYKALAPASQRAIDLLAKRLNMKSGQLAQMFSDFRSTTGKAPTLASVLDARDLANVEDLAARSQTAAGIAGDAADAARAALPGELSRGVAAGGPVDRVANLRVAQGKAMDQAMGTVRDNPVLITPDDMAFFHDPLVRSAIRGDPVLARKVGNAARALSDDEGNLLAEAVADSMTVNDFERLRQALRGRQGALLNAGRPTVARDLGDRADEAAKFAAEQHPEYGKALEDFAAHERFIQGFEHAQAGKSGLDVADASLLRTLDTPEGAAGLETGARARLVAQAGKSESSATSTAKGLAETTTPASRESLPPGEQAQLRRLGAAHTREQGNLNRLAAPLKGRVEEEGAALKDVGELAVAGVGHTTTGFAAHAVARFIRKYSTRSSTAEEAVRILTDPARAAQLPDALRKAGLSARNQRIVLSKVAQRTGRLTGSAAGAMQGE